jgi:CheY-like chemotaxis protein
MSQTSTILVIDDEPQIRKFLRISLASQGYKVLEAGTGTEGLSQAALNKPDLLVLDLGLPDMDGQDVLREFREWSKAPVVVLSVRASEGQKVLALDNGANDYVTKPFGIQEFLARIRALLRQAPAGEQQEAALTFGPLLADRGGAPAAKAAGRPDQSTVYRDRGRGGVSVAGGVGFFCGTSLFDLTLSPTSWLPQGECIPIVGANLLANGFDAVVRQSTILVLLIPIHCIPRNFPAQGDQFRGFVELEEAAHALGHVDQYIRRIAGDFVLGQ